MDSCILYWHCCGCATGRRDHVPKMRAIRLAIPQGSDALSAVLQTKLLPVSVRLRTFVALGIVFIMGAKLPLGPSVLALLADSSSACSSVCRCF